MLKICPILPEKTETCLRDGLRRPVLLWQYVSSKRAGANVALSVTLKDKGLISSIWRQIISQPKGVTCQLYHSSLLN